MDAMEQAEEDRRLKEEAELRELLEAVGLDDYYFSSRDLVHKGKDVHPSGKQRKVVQEISQTLKVSTSNVNSKTKPSMLGSFSEEIDDFSDMKDTKDFDLNNKPRIFIASGFVNKHEPDKILRKVVRRFLFLFNDVLLVTLKKDNAEIYDLQQVLWVKDLRLRYVESDAQMGNNPVDVNLSFEIIVSKNRNREQSRLLFSCDNENNKAIWMQDLENVFLAYHRDTDTAKHLGWFHEIIQGTFHSAAALGDVLQLRRHLNFMSENNIPIDSVDKAGMSALHWVVLKGHETCARLLFDRGADVDLRQKGYNTPLLLAAGSGQETIARLLIEKGADIFARNAHDFDAVLMAVVYGHATKGLPWTLQLLNFKGLDLNRADKVGATPLHLCAERNLARPVRMLVDSGADVNVKHGKTQLTPLQMACSHAHPDVETIRSFLDKGAYPNWKDVQGRTAFDLALQCPQVNESVFHNSFSVVTSPASTSSVGGSGKKAQNDDGTKKNDMIDLLMSINEESSDDISQSGYLRPEDLIDKSIRSPPVANNNTIGKGQITPRWRDMEGTIEKVGNWAVKALPAILEICKKGGRFNPKDLDFLRPSFRAAVMEAREVWLKKIEPSNFVEFVMIREQSGEDLRLHKESWTKNNTSNICQLCSDSFGMKNRRHHCRCCGVLTCANCSSKRVQLTAIDNDEDISKGHNGSSNSLNAIKKKEDKQERVCDGCFNRLLHECSQPSPDHFRVKQLKQCALDVIHSIEDLIDSLDDPEGDPNAFLSSVRQTKSLTRGLDTVVANGIANATNNSRSNKSSLLLTNNNNSGNSPTIVPIKSNQSQIEVLKLRESRLHRTEDTIAKFLEAGDGYHRISKKLIEQKTASTRLWGGTSTTSD
eukprot:gene4781-6706_t